MLNLNWMVEPGVSRHRIKKWVREDTIAKISSVLQIGAGEHKVLEFLISVCFLLLLCHENVVLKRGWEAWLRRFLWSGCSPRIVYGVCFVNCQKLHAAKKEIRAGRSVSRWDVGPRSLRFVLTPEYFRLRSKCGSSMLLSETRVPITRTHWIDY